MRMIIKNFAFAVCVLAAICSAFACAQESVSKIGSRGGEIVFAGPEQGSWSKVFYSNKKISQQLFPGENAHFDESGASDLSTDKKYLKINKVSQGAVQSEDFEEEYERAYCVFIEMASGCIVRQETGSFCGGEWGDEGSIWVWGGEKVLIDQHSQISDTDIERLSGKGADENFSRCLGRE